MKCWPIIFKIANELGIRNILHIYEISLVTPLINAESGRVFSFLWRAFSKERSSLKNETLEMLLHVRGDEDFSNSRYEDAVSMFLNEYPDGSIRQWKRRVEGCRYLQSRKSLKKTNNNVNTALDLLSSDEEENPQGTVMRVEDIQVESISDDDWSDASSSDDIK